MMLKMTSLTEFRFFFHKFSKSAVVNAFLTLLIVHLYDARHPCLPLRGVIEEGRSVIIAITMRNKVCAMMLLLTVLFFLVLPVTGKTIITITITTIAFYHHVHLIACKNVWKQSMPLCPRTRFPA